ncbi:MAG: SPFH domain-containing protein [Chloroflexi bacterium]|nr:SPFH domain-containing protein [Chloroflexota bacterium]
MAVSRDFSRIKEVVASWDSVQRVLRTGDQGALVPVVIPKDRRALWGPFWIGFGLYTAVTNFWLFWRINVGFATILALVSGLFFGAIGLLVWWRSARVEIEQGTTGVRSRWGKIVGMIKPGRQFLWWPWEKVEYIVDTSTEIPYTAPILACPTKESVPLRSIEFFLKFRIEDPIKFVRRIGASNFDMVLSSGVQDAIRRRSRIVQTADAYDLRGSDVGDMQETLNRQLGRYGVRITGANIPDVQLPQQYQDNLSTREKVSKELAAYEKEWELIRKRRNDALLLEIERAKKERAAKLIAVQEAINKAREDVAQMLQKKEAQAEKIRLEIEAEGRAKLKSAENEARALHRLGRSYKDNQAVLQYQLAVRRLDVAERLVQEAPRPIIVNHSPKSDDPTLSTLLLANLLPEVMEDGNSRVTAVRPPRVGGNRAD